MKTFFSRFATDQSGSSAIEYGLIAAMVSVVLVGAVTTLGGQIAEVFSQVAAAVPVD
ncbi:Flp family type IVb pilin [Phenylobacterium sp.]|uniref:Flp family type IVb pilin n=1 Tax=Phenylobacterium sp. TaxID=1871053 RepID=UPI00273445F6|nr:Flp family type IVb pilin [Phenylobacterium sp.]MDP3855658.1 Flp family type IVb pilin [Phenylobacterium sp.]